MESNLQLETPVVTTTIVKESTRSMRDNRWFESVGALIGGTGRGLLITDNSGKICYTNERFADIVGYASDECYGHNPRMFQSGKTAPETYFNMWNTISSGRTWRGIIQNRRKNGKKFLEDITISPMLDNRGAITHFCGLVDTVDSNAAPQIKRLEPEFSNAFESVANGVAHEINNSLTGIIGHCSFLRRSEDASTETTRRVDTITSIADRLHAFSNKLSVCAGASLYRPKLVELNKVVTDTLNKLEQTTDLNQVMCYLSEIPICTIGNSELLQAALLELIYNSLQAKPQIESDITVSVLKTTWDGPSIARGTISRDFGLHHGEVGCIEVIDQAAGMEQSLLDCATELFFSTKAVHAGLGLPVVIGIARSHRGALEILSFPGAGTRVRLFLPLSKI